MLLRNKHSLLLFCLLLLPALFFAIAVSAQDFSSDTYTVSNPVLLPGGYSTSDNFTLFGVISEMSIGTSTTNSLYQLFGGFLYFPFVSTPVVIATSGDAQVALTWTSADASTGWAVGGYAVGQSTVSGGPYTYSDVGLTLASTRTGLINNATYYFVIRVADAFGNPITTSAEVSAVPIASPPVSGGGGGGGGGGSGGGIVNISTGVKLSGRAYPLSRVSILKDGQISLTTIAGPDSHFSATLSGLSSGNYVFSVYGEDNKSIRSNPFTFPIFITSGVITEVSGIFIAPTIALDKSEVKRGDNIAIFGQSVQSSDIVININSDSELFINSKSDKNGIYLLNFDSSALEYGDHSARSKALSSGEISYFSHTAGFIVGTKNVLAQSNNCGNKGDLNSDCRVNLVDFSIAAFWYRKPLNLSFKTLELERLNGDGKVDLIDFSIMAYYWTG